MIVIIIIIISIGFFVNIYQCSLCITDKCSNKYSKTPLVLYGTFVRTMSSFCFGRIVIEHLQVHLRLTLVM